MKKLKSPFLKNFYLLLLSAIFLIIIFTPFLVKNVSLANEEYAEFIALSLLLALAYLTRISYKKESKIYEQQLVKLNRDQKNLEERLTGAFEYIGSVNIQMQELESIFTKIDKYPETKQEIKKILNYLAERILSIVNAEWVILRIVNIPESRTLSEMLLSRDKSKANNENISNKKLINQEATEGLSVISSTDENFTINTYCILPGEISREQKILVESITNQAEMLYIIFSSIYYKKKG